MTSTTGFPLRQSKLQRPRVLRNVVPRPRLWSLLDRGAERPLTLVCAGPGFGKTTLVSSWLAQQGSPSGPPVPTAWLSLDEQDELAVFLHYFIVALRTLVADACADSLALLQSPRTARRSLLHTTLINDLIKLPHDVIVVLDDFSTLPSLAVSELLIEMLRTWPQRLHLVIITRRNPALPLPSLRAKDLLTEIRSQQLRFSHAETAAYLTCALEAELNDADIGVVEQQSEGWITGIKLAVLAWRSSAAEGAAHSQWAANAASANEYFIDEVLAKQPAQIQRFLLNTSILDHFSASLSAAVLGEDSAGGEAPDEGAPDWSAGECIDWLVHEDLFTVALTGSSEWHRYHHLLRDLLRRRLAAQATPGAIAELHRRAASWFAQHDLVEEALHHAVQADDVELVSRLIEQGIPDVLNREDRATLERWLKLLPWAHIDSHPALLLLKVWVLQFNWQLGAQARVLDQIDALLRQQRAGNPNPADIANPAGGPDPLELQLDLIRGQAAYLSNQPVRALEYLAPALANFPPGWTYLRGGAVLYAGVSMQANGGFVHAERWLLDQFERYPDKKDGFALRLCMSLCFCYLAEGRLEQARQTAQDMLRQSQASNLPTTESWAHYFLGVVCHYHNQLELAEQHFTFLLKYEHAAIAIVVCQGLAHLALIRQVRGRQEEANHVLDVMEELDLDVGGRVTDSTHAMRAWLQLLQDDAERALRWAHTFTAPVPDAPLLWLANPHLIQARILIAGGEKADLLAACHSLDALAEIATRTCNRRYKIEILALRALACYRLHHRDLALADLRESLELASVGGFERIYLGLGPDMAQMLKELHSQGLGVEPLLAQFADAPPSITSLNARDNARNNGNSDDSGSLSARPLAPLGAVHGMIEPLTMRETEVLALLREPLSMKEIARKLVVADSTVKRHTINIYGKLGVNRRWDAVAKAEALGYLPKR